MWTLFEEKYLGKPRMKIEEGKQGHHKNLKPLLPTATVNIKHQINVTPPTKAYLSSYLLPNTPC